MNNPFHSLKNPAYIFLLGSVLTSLTYAFLDKPLAFWVYQHPLEHYYVLHLLTHIADLFTAATFFIYLLVAIRFYLSKLTDNDQALLVIANSAAITMFIRGVLKLIFSRYWPATWVNNNPSLLRDHVYGFNWFHGGIGYASFPSGHTAIVVAVMTAIWFLYPRWRWAVVPTIALVIIGLLGLNFHFLSDVIAGGALGYFVAITAVQMSGLKRRTDNFNSPRGGAAAGAYENPP